jgi:hypothetical protein
LSRIRHPSGASARRAISASHSAWPGLLGIGAVHRPAEGDPLGQRMTCQAMASVPIRLSARAIAISAVQSLRPQADVGRIAQRATSSPRPSSRQLRPQQVDQPERGVGIGKVDRRRRHARDQPGQRVEAGSPSAT